MKVDSSQGSNRELLRMIKSEQEYRQDIQQPADPTQATAEDMEHIKISEEARELNQNRIDDGQSRMEEINRKTEKLRLERKNDEEMKAIDKKAAEEMIQERIAASRKNEEIHATNAYSGGGSMSHSGMTINDIV